MANAQGENFEGSQGGDVCEKSKREVTLTERGLNYQVEQRTLSVKRLMSQWHREAEKISIVLSDSNEINVITESRDSIVKVMNELREEYSRLNTLLGTDREKSSMDEKYEFIEQEQHKLLVSTADILREIRSNASAVFSKARSTSFSQHLSHKSSVKSSSSRKQELIEKAEALKIQLKYLEVESQAKLEYEKIMAHKELDIAQATLVAHETFQEEEEAKILEIPKIALPTINKTELVKTYITTHTKDTPTTEEIVQQNSIVNAKTETFEKTPSSLNPITGTKQAPQSASNFPPQPTVSDSNCKTTNPLLTTTNVTKANYTNTILTTANMTKPSHAITKLPQGKQSIYVPKFVDVKPKVSKEQKHSTPLDPLAVSFKPTITTNTPTYMYANPSVVHMDHQNGNQQTTVEPAVETGLSAIAQSLVDQVNLGRLPPPEPPIFSGDPLLYAGWKAAFKTLIEQRRIPKTEQIHYLKKYLSGSAKEAVENYFLLSSENAYDEAKKLLDERFGDPFVIGNAFRDKLEGWPKIAPRDGKALLKFSDFLKQCHAAMVSIGTLRILDDDRENRKLMTKLPDWLATRWGRTVYNWKQDHMEFPPFKVFMEFVTKEAKIASDPVTALRGIDHKHSSVVKSSNRNVESRSFAVDTKEQKKPEVKCVLCGKDHYLDKCKSFLEKEINDRKEFARNKKLCFGCLKPGHISKNCRRRKKCDKCSKLHPTVFHGDVEHAKAKPKESSTSNNIQSTSNKEDLPSHSKVSFLSNSKALNKNSMVLPVYLSHSDSPENEKLVYAMLDTQSDTSFILDDTCKSLGISGRAVTLKLSTMLAEDKTVHSTRFKGLIVRGYDSNIRISLPDTFSRNIIPANRNHIPTPDIAKSWAHLSVIADKLSPLRDCEIGLLIGYNCPKALMPREVIAPHDDLDGPYAQKTDLGWGIVGIVDTEYSGGEDDNIGVSHRTLVCEVPPNLVSPSSDQPDIESVAFAFRTKIKVDPIDISRLLELDFSEKTACDEVVMSQEDKRFMKLVGEGIRRDDTNGHYSMPLPFKGESPVLPNNKFVALKRLENLTKRFKADKKYYELYKDFVRNLLQHGHAEVVQTSQVDSGREWYIPHHGVFHPRKPDKLRVVFDCSAKFKGHSLNDHLLQGPDLTNALIGVLCRFRKERIAFTCDIEQMFHQFMVHTGHRDYLRFLWWKDDEMSEVVVFRMCVHLFGATSSPGCANFGLKKIASDNETEIGIDIADFLRKDFYVDDGLKSVASVDEAVHMIKSSQAMCKNGGVRLHKISSNSKDVLNAIPEEDRAKGLKDMDLFNSTLPIEHTLGVQWNIQSDSFQFRITLDDKPLTRRGILSTVSSVYDPLGFISPVVLVGKQILQQTCGDNIDWDDPIPDQLHMRWERWRNDLKNLVDFQVKRCVKPDEFETVETREFHHFSDASTVGYGQCSYLRTIDKSGQVHCSLLMGKSRVAPRKAMTIPRLELTAAVVSVKVHALLRREFNFDDATHYFWTDSSVVLGYIANEAKRFHVFVGNRVQQIRDQTNPSQWRYVPTKENPADIASRGATATELISSNWINGPSFLWKSELSFFLDTEIASKVEFNDDPEVKKVQAFATNTVDKQSTQTLLERIKYFSRWNDLKRAVANCLLFKRLLRNRVEERNSGIKEESVTRTITVEDLQQAETEIIRIVQRDYFEKDIDKLVREIPISNESPLYRLDPVLDENGLIRVGGRNRQSLDAFEVKHPVILPRKCHVTDLLIMHYHEKVQHQGRGITTNELRSNGLWILGCSTAVSNAIYYCITCRKLRGRSQGQKMADLPTDRVDPAPPFSYCGVDYFGPFLVKEGRKEFKRYGVIFTCFTSRAIHLEIANSLDTDSFINALRRFLCLRGPVRQIRSDRGSNFIGAKSELERAVSEMDDERVAQFLKNEGCDYFNLKTNVPHASHMGGVWERQIKTVRNILTTLLCNFGKQLDDEALRTFICEVTAIVNSRPLTVENINDPLSTALTPNHLLTMKSRIILPPPGKFVKPDLYVRRRWRRIQYLANEFWFKWRREYLNNLQSRGKWTRNRRNLQVGDVVMLEDENLSRNTWKLGRVVQAHADDDGLVRKVRLVVGTSDLDNKGHRKAKLSELDRPIHKLILLQETEEVPDEEPV